MKNPNIIIDTSMLCKKRALISENFLNELLSHQDQDDHFFGLCDMAITHKRRLTQHLIIALLFCGFHPESLAISKAYEWFIY